MIVFLIIRLFIRRGEEGEQPSNRTTAHSDDNKISNKKISKDVGEYVDYEDVDK